MNTVLRAGFACRNITPSVGTAMSGFVIRQRPAVAIHDPLFARALVLDDGVTRCCLLFLDLIGVDLEIRRTIQHGARAAAPDLHVSVVATHTHGGPPVLPGALLGPVDPTYRTHVVAQAIAAATEATANAAADRRPATVRFGLANETTIARNRRDPDGPIDPDVPVLVVEHDGDVAGLLVSYACHPVTLGPDNLQVTRDYPDQLVVDLEQAFPGAFVAFAPGCCGQINTGHRAEDSLRDGAAAQRTFAEARRIGRTLARAAERAVQTAMSSRPAAGPLRVTTKSLRLPLAPAPDTTDAELAGWLEELARIAGEDSPREAMLGTLVSWGTTVHRRAPSEVEVDLVCVALGDVGLALYPGEVFVEFGLELKAMHPSLRLMTIAFANAAPGYLPHRSAYPAGGYEVDEAYRFYGRSGPFPPAAGERVQTEMFRLVHSIYE